MLNTASPESFASCKRYWLVSIKSTVLEFSPALRTKTGTNPDDIRSLLLSATSSCLELITFAVCGMLFQNTTESVPKLVPLMVNRNGELFAGVLMGANAVMAGGNTTVLTLVATGALPFPAPHPIITRAASRTEIIRIPASRTLILILDWEPNFDRITSIGPPINNHPQCTYSAYLDARTPDGLSAVRKYWAGCWRECARCFTPRLPLNMATDGLTGRFFGAEIFQDQNGRQSTAHNITK